MRVTHVASGMGLTLSVLCVASASAHHSFAPHFDSSKPVSIEGTVT